MRGAEPALRYDSPDFEEEFLNLVDRLDPQTRETAGFLKIVRTADNEGDYEKALGNLKKFLAERETMLDQTSFADAHGYEISKDGMAAEMANIRLAMSNPESFIGNGAVANVFSMRSIYKKQSVCVKVVFDNQMYSEGNSVHKEIRFLDAIQDIQVAGVRSPMPYYSFCNLNMTGVVMEQLDASNLSRIREKQTTEGIKDELPENFDIDDYFRRVKEFLVHLHGLGIYHGDVALRNLMVDRKTGLPYVIDFGKARMERDLDKSNINLPDYAKSDLAALESAKEELREWLKGQKASK